MLIKGVACRVASREACDRGQRAWAAPAGLPGFLGQCGGRSRRESGLAQVFGRWADEGSYRRFMAGAHDAIAAAGAGTYESIDVRLFERRLDIGDDIGGAVLRLAHCRVKANRREHFARAQAEIWNPGMAAAPGLVGGVFAQRGEAEFLVLSGWTSEAEHAATSTAGSRRCGKGRAPRTISRASPAT